MTTEVAAVVPEVKPSTVVLVEKTIKVTKEANDIAVALVALTESVMQANKDGFQAMTDVPVVIMENLKTLGAAIDGAGKLKEEAKDHLPEFINAFTSAGSEIAAKVLK